MTGSVRGRRAQLASAPFPVVILVAVAVVLSGCAGATTDDAAGWTIGPTLAPTASGAAPSGGPSAAPAASVIPTASPTPTASPVAVATTGPTPTPNGTPKTFSGRMTPQVVLNDGYVSMYMDLENTGLEPLTFINTLYDIEPTRLYAPVVAFPWTTGENAVYTRAGRFFPSPSIVQPGERAVYVMGGMKANGSGELATPVANIKFCPTRGMDDLPSLPVEVDDVDWSTSDGITTVTGTLVQTAGAERVDPPVVGVAFFDDAGSFLGAVVDSRVGLRLEPGRATSFTMDGRGVASDRIARAEAWAFVS